MSDQREFEGVPRRPQEQMLRLVAKGFYQELVKYGVKEREILTVAAHLLDNVMQKSAPRVNQAESYRQFFRLGDVLDRWAEEKRLGLHEVAVRPIEASRAETVAGWLSNEKVRNSFFPRFPESPSDLRAYFSGSDREYLEIHYQDQFVGIIGAENADAASRKLEMRKLVGDPSMRGRGIGKRATFLFLYHVFVTRRFHKVYLHTLDINIRSLNLNGNLGFVLEGVFFDDLVIDGVRQDIVRMALTEPTWRELFT